MREGAHQLDDTKQLCAVHTRHQVSLQKEWDEGDGLSTLKSAVILSDLQQVCNLDDLVPLNSTSNVQK